MLEIANVGCAREWCECRDSDEDEDDDGARAIGGASIAARSQSFVGRSSVCAHKDRVHAASSKSASAADADAAVLLLSSSSSRTWSRVLLLRSWDLRACSRCSCACSCALRLVRFELRGRKSESGRNGRGAHINSLHRLLRGQTFDIFVWKSRRLGRCCCSCCLGGLVQCARRASTSSSSGTCVRALLACLVCVCACIVAVFASMASATMTTTTASVVWFSDCPVKYALA